MNNNYIDNDKFIKVDSTIGIKKEDNKKNFYKIKNILDTSFYKKHDGIKIEKWTILLR